MTGRSGYGGATGRSRARRWVVYAVVVAVVAAVVSFIRLGDPGDPHQRFFFGTLQTSPRTAGADKARGMRVAHMSVYWDRFEPAPGQVDQHYVAALKRKLRMFRDAGLHVEAGVGLNNPPSWLSGRYPEDAFTDQGGARFTSTPNLVFSQEIRNEVEGYLRRLDQEIGLGNFWALRIGVNDTGEFTYPPPASSSGGAASYWAFDRHAQASGADPGRPATVPPNPYPGWRPGQTTYHGASFTVGQVSRWYDWYVAALADAVNWQTRQYEALGYHGLLLVLIPGGGFYPSDLSTAVRAHLGATADAGLISRGAGFFRTIGLIEHRRTVQLVSTALVDGSGTPRNNTCRPADGAVTPDALTRGTEARARTWSSVRWISRIAAHEGFVISGESAGPHVAAYYPGVMNDAARQLKSCGLTGLMWAFDHNLYDGTPGSSLGDYASVIAKLQRGATP
ncbi:beta-galactosidase [Streptomyces sp. SLBN-31]|uniref:beta-galactosidase n=1 Tax=Streptomyces sp. SLBN-31 TaxID=2768444 RepID=UPI00114F9BD1|nr:beta-galactosidase [Streptomyces sp. SLBN-31]TQJ91462.1 beta-galactosidase-like protein [Streptomyces sp. SLBN-31]